FIFFLLLRRPPTATLFPTRRSSDLEGSILMGVSRGDGVRLQEGEVCAPQVLIQIPAKLEVIEGQQITLEFALAQGLSYSSFARWGTAQVQDQSQSFDWNNNYSSRRRITIPQFSANDPRTVEDGGRISVTVAGLIGNQPAHIGNSLELRVFEPDLDYDGDGLSNRLEVETPGLSAATADSNQDGRPDGDEDLDGDGLTNLQEVAAGTSL